jgi:hypothetical protein
MNEWKNIGPFGHTSNHVEIILVNSECDVNAIWRAMPMLRAFWILWSAITTTRQQLIIKLNKLVIRSNQFCWFMVQINPSLWLFNTCFRCTWTQTWVPRCADSVTHSHTCYKWFMFPVKKNDKIKILTQLFYNPKTYWVGFTCTSLTSYILVIR